MNRAMKTIKMILGLGLGSFFFALTFNYSAYAQEHLSLEERLDYETGRAIFEKIWVSSPASTTASDGLGPLYNARSCVQCHENGGRGGVENSLVLHINDAVYGQQIQTFAIFGLSGEAKVNLVSNITLLTLSGDENVAMHQPEYSLGETGFGELALTNYSPRIASSLAGLGLIERIPQASIIALADENDRNGDGISGRVNWVQDSKQGTSVMGLFGWKAAQPTLELQTARALNIDMGISSALYNNPYGDCTNSQPACLDRVHGNSPRHDNLEASQIMLDSLLFYVRNIPAPKHNDLKNASVSNGAKLFQSAACNSCHHQQFEISSGLIKPFSDFLLHDMGERLSDKLGESDGISAEWRTAPLWGVGKINSGYMHDGRARTLQEAILWHGGEAKGSLDKYQSMAKPDRDDLIRFLNTL